jgi:antitoxin component YwqK of YwqJK toxin-antitoxin module
LKYRELDFLEKYKSISNGNFVVNLPNGKICVSGEIENSLPVGKWMFYDFNGVFNKSINYRRGKKFRKK